VHVVEQLSGVFEFEKHPGEYRALVEAAVEEKTDAKELVSDKSNRSSDSCPLGGQWLAFRSRRPPRHNEAGAFDTRARSHLAVEGAFAAFHGAKNIVARGRHRSRYARRRVATGCRHAIGIFGARLCRRCSLHGLRNHRVCDARFRNARFDQSVLRNLVRTTARPLVRGRVTSVRSGRRGRGTGQRQPHDQNTNEPSRRRNHRRTVT